MAPSQSCAPHASSLCWSTSTFAGAAGQTFIETLRGDEQLAAMPVLVTSKSDDMDAIERCLECGADDYLPSVFGPAVLRMRVNAALDRRRVQDGQNLRREMSVARTIQRDFLPESLPDVGGHGARGRASPCARRLG